MQRWRQQLNDGDRGYAINGEIQYHRVAKRLTTPSITRYPALRDREGGPGCVSAVAPAISPARPAPLSTRLRTIG